MFFFKYGHKFSPPNIWLPFKVIPLNGHVEGPLYSLREAWLGNLFSCKSWFEIYSWFMIKDGKIFSCPHKQIFYSNVTREWRVELNRICEPFCFAWWISSYLTVWKCTNCLGFWHDMDFLWINKTPKIDH